VENTILDLVSRHGYVGLFFLLMFGIVGIPVPDELLLTFAGSLVYRGRLELVPTMLTAFFGSCCGITLSYAIGRLGGFLVLRRFGRYLHLGPDRIDKVHAFFERRGRWALTFGYFFAGVRHVTALIAGSSKLEPHAFAIFAYSGAALWSASFILFGYLLGEQWAAASEQARRVLLFATIGLGAVVLVVLIVRKVRRPRPAVPPEA
jgi:membrane protein DedA with SNARE-associated domain